MKEDLLSEGHNIVRYVKPSNLDGEEVKASEFSLRSGESGISVNWLEYYAELSKSEQLAEIRKVTRLTLRQNGRYAELNVGTMCSRLAGELDTLKIFRSPLDEEDGYKADPSHSEIAGLPPSGSDQAALVADILTDCVFTLHPAIEE